MANRLKKLADVQYKPASPYVAAKPAYCEKVVVKWTKRTVYYGEGGGIADGGGILSGGAVASIQWVPTYKTTCYPDQPAIEAVPSSTSYSSVLGWNSGGRSVEPLRGDGYFEFRVGPNPVGVAIGLSPNDASTLPAEPAHAFYVHGSTVDVIEYGQAVATSANAHATALPLRITRRGAQVSYRHGDWTHDSALDSFGDQYLDSAMYASGDFVDDPVMGQIASGSMTLPAIQIIGGDTASYAQGRVELPAIQINGSGTTTLVATGEMTLPMLRILGSDRPYGEGHIELPGVTLEGNGGFPVGQLIHGQITVPLVSIYGTGLTGTVASGEMTLPRIQIIGSDRPYGAGQIDLPTPRIFGLTQPKLDYGSISSPLLLGGTIGGTRSPSGSISSPLRIGYTQTLSRVLGGSIVSGLLLGGTVSGLRSLSGSIRSPLLLGGTIEAPAIATQYAVNALTGALTTYQGFDFQHFAHAGNAVYACRPDGLFQLRPGDDDGQPISAYIDFGATDYDQARAKTVTDIFLGLATDGDVRVTLRADGVSYDYPAVRRGDLMRAVAAKGVSARRWNLELEISDATELELDSVEHLLGVSARRTTR